MTQRSDFVRKFAVLLPILAGICWGIAGVFIRYLDGTGLNNPTIVFTRTSVGTVLVFLFLLITDKNKLKVKIKDLPILCGVGFVGSVLLMCCYNIAVSELTLSLAAVLLSMSPIVVLIAGTFLFKEKITVKKVFCMVAAIVGCAMLSGIFELSSGLKLSAIGIIMGLGAMVSNGIYIIISRYATDRGYGALTICLYSCIAASIILSPFIDWKTLGEFITSDVATSTIFLLVQSVCTSLIPSVVYIMGLRHVETGKAAILEGGSEPAAAMAVGIIIYAEIPTVIGAIGMVVTIVALAVLSSDGGDK